MISRSDFLMTQNNYNGLDVYGLKITCANGASREYRFISPLSSEVKRLIDQMQASDIAALHYDDVVADYLRELFYEKMAFNGLENHAFG